MSRVLLSLFGAFLVFALSGCAGLAAGSEGQADPATADKPKGKTSRPARTARPTPEPTRPPLTLADLLGSDGRLTVLILGSDAREGVIGHRTDAIIVATIDPGTGKVAMVSLPRDTVNVPIAPGQAYSGRINSLFWEYERATGKTKEALKKTKKALAYAFGTEIDYYAMVDFDGLVRLINSIGGVDVTLTEALIDPTMHLGTRGLRLKPGQRHLDGKKALAFSRSRHADSDYDRSRRQQQVLVAAADQVRARGLRALPSLVELVRKKTVTDLPLRAAPVLLELASRAKLTNPRSIVLAPDRWARQLPGTYTITPRVLEVQKMFDRVFKPLP
jgi:LCP family protein required for cell wall assembly